MFAKRTNFTGSFLGAAAGLAFAPLSCAVARGRGAADDPGRTVQIVGFTPTSPTASERRRQTLLAQDGDDVIETARRANISIQ